MRETEARVGAEEVPRLGDGVFATGPIRSPKRGAGPVAARHSNAWATTSLALVFCFFWSSAFTANKINLRYASPLWNLAIRCTIAGLLVLVWGWRAQIRWPRGWRPYARLMLFGLFNTTGYMLFTLLGLQQVSAGTAAIIASTHPLLLALVAPIALGERLTRTKLIGVLLGALAVWWVMAVRTGAHDTLPGMAWIGAGVCSLIAGTLLFKRYPPSESLLIVNGVQLIASGALLLPLAYLDSSSRHVELTWQLMLGLGYVTLAVNILGMAIWLWLLNTNEASKVSSYYFLTPIIGLALGAVVLGEHFGAREIVGLGGVVVAIYLVNLTPAPQTPIEIGV